MKGMDVLTLSRIQFADTAIFHIIWPLLSIGLAFYLVLMEGMWLRTKDAKFYHQARFWTKIFVLTFAIGVSSGFPLSFQFGTNWAEFSKAAGSFFGNILGFETTIAFTLETASLGIFLFGWKRVPKIIHFLSGVGVFVGASLSGFWIVVANSWMQVPRGIHMEDGKIIVDNYMEAIFNPSSLVSYGHMWLACIETTLFFMAGLCALALLNKAKESAFFLTAFKYVLGLMLIVTPLQIGFGHLIGLVVAEHQPAKLAASELHWDVNKPGDGAAWNIIAWPNEEGTGNAFELGIPAGLSLIVTDSLTGTVQGLNEFPKDERPNAIESTITFYAFRVMVAIGVILLLLSFLGAWYWWKKRLTVEGVQKDRLFWWLFVGALPLGFIATEAGWVVREVGRQPWVMYHLLKTSDAVSAHLESSVISLFIIGLTTIFAIMFILFVFFTYRIVRAGPDLSAPVP
ncbi:MAG: cytochrome d ubiquinol oxidase subunit I [Parcubacteria bacterium C7867-001]|nr:MAG: cytochrome d ubiquinol oxidase subunit I [Parcubacteria bacterium C7867-001]